MLRFISSSIPECANFTQTTKKDFFEKKTIANSLCISFYKNPLPQRLNLLVYRINLQALYFNKNTVEPSARKPKQPYLRIALNKYIFLSLLWFRICFWPPSKHYMSTTEWFKFRDLSGTNELCTTQTCHKNTTVVSNST